MQDRIKRLEYWIVGGMGASINDFINGHSMNLTRNFSLLELN